MVSHLVSEIIISIYAWVNGTSQNTTQTENIINVLKNDQLNKKLKTFITSTIKNNKVFLPSA